MGVPCIEDEDREKDSSVNAKDCPSGELEDSTSWGERFIGKNRITQVIQGEFAVRMYFFQQKWF